MGNTKTKENPKSMNEAVYVDCQVESGAEKHDCSKIGEAQCVTPKNEKLKLSAERTNKNTSQMSLSASNSNIMSLALDDADDLPYPKRPQLKLYNDSSSTNISSQLSVLRESEDKKPETVASPIEYVDIPPSLSDLIKPENARKNVMELFEVIQTLGEGMSSCVFEVKHVVTGQKYALKRLRREQSHSDLLFAGECKFLSVLKSQGVIRTIDAFVDEMYYYVLNELGATDLFKRIKANEKFCEKTAIEIIRYLLETLKEMHQNNMVHRDIKPENVVFTDKQSNCPKLIDFGDAIVVKDSKVYTELVGTQCYLSPERWRQHYGWELKASDIWAVGVLAYEMVTGKRCFYAPSDKQLVEKIEKCIFKFPPGLKPSNLCCHFIRSLLTIDDKHRPTAEFALHHPWLLASEDAELQRSLIESWNLNVSKALSWTVYKPNSKKVKSQQQ